MLTETELDGYEYEPLGMPVEFQTNRSFVGAERSGTILYSVRDDHSRCTCDQTGGFWSPNGVAFMYKVTPRPIEVSWWRVTEEDLKEASGRSSP